MRKIKFLARCVGVWKVWNLWGNSVELFPKKVGNDLWGRSFWHAFGTLLARLWHTKKAASWRVRQLWG